VVEVEAAAVVVVVVAVVVFIVAVVVQSWLVSQSAKKCLPLEAVTKRLVKTEQIEN
jgi:hypothetical protein